MKPFMTRFPEMAKKEMIILKVEGDANDPVVEGELPPGEYGYLECFCADPDCDCRTVLIFVVSPHTRELWASIHFGWESPDFYHSKFPGHPAADLMAGAMLDPINPQTKYSEKLFKYFQETALSDPAYIEGLKRRYDLYRSTCTKKTKHDTLPKRNKLLRAKPPKKNKKRR